MSGVNDLTPQEKQNLETEIHLKRSTMVQTLQRVLNAPDTQPLFPMNITGEQSAALVLVALQNFKPDKASLQFLSKYFDF